MHGTTKAMSRRSVDPTPLRFMRRVAGRIGEFGLFIYKSPYFEVLCVGLLCAILAVVCSLSAYVWVSSRPIGVPVEISRVVITGSRVLPPGGTLQTVLKGHRTRPCRSEIARHVITDGHRVIEILPPLRNLFPITDAPITRVVHHRMPADIEAGRHKLHMVPIHDCYDAVYESLPIEIPFVVTVGGTG